jgi:hypothetical protein
VSTPPSTYFTRQTSWLWCADRANLGCTTKNAVVQEAIRLSHGPIFRSARVAPTESLIYKNLEIPAGVRVP